jgi:Putative peptidoglycan binding domain
VLSKRKRQPGDRVHWTQYLDTAGTVASAVVAAFALIWATPSAPQTQPSAPQTQPSTPQTQSWRYSEERKTYDSPSTQFVVEIAGSFPPLQKDPDLEILRIGLQDDPRIQTQLEQLRFSRSKIVQRSIQINTQRMLQKQGVEITKKGFLSPFIRALDSDHAAEQEQAVQALETLLQEAPKFLARNLEAQRRLSQLGFNPGAIDGVIGPKTRAALSAYQRAHNLQVTGGLDIGTLQALSIGESI